MYQVPEHLACGAKAIPTSLSSIIIIHLEIISQSIKPTVERLSYILHDSSISRDPHLLTYPSSALLTLQTEVCVILDEIKQRILGAEWPKRN